MYGKFIFHIPIPGIPEKQKCETHNILPAFDNLAIEKGFQFTHQMTVVY